MSDDRGHTDHTDPAGAAAGDAGGRGADDRGAERRAAEGVDHLQAAANEMIAAARSFLDAVEEVVRDRDTMATVVDTFSTIAEAAGQAASRVAPTRGRSGPGADGPDEDEPPPGVQHIRVS